MKTQCFYSICFPLALPLQVKVAITVDSKASLRDLRDRISRVIKVPEKQLVLLYLDHENGLRELTKDDQLIMEILDELQEIFAIETPKVKSTNDPSLHLTLVFVNRIGSGSQGRLFGPIFSCDTPRDASFLHIQQVILGTLRPILKKTVKIDKFKDTVLFKLRVVGGLPGKCYLPDDVDHPLFMPTIDKAIAYCETTRYRGPIHLMLVVEWNAEDVEKTFIPEDKIASPVIDPTVAFVREKAQKSSNHVSLLDCLDLNFREEKLADENAWICPNCERKQQTAKKLSLWSLPDVLICHLKRFRQASNCQRTKLSIPVIFPLHNLDMNAYLVPRARSTRLKDAGMRDVSLDRSWNSGGSLPSQLNHPWQRPSLRWSRLIHCNDDDSNTYDLYAVVNHIGNMSSGHYTAFCKNAIDQLWYSFDDTRVTQISEADVVTSDAYILFYQKKSLSSPSPVVASSTTTATCPTSDFIHSPDSHWINQIYTNGHINNVRVTMDDIRSYATMPNVRRSRSRLYDLFFKKPNGGAQQSESKERLISRSPSPHLTLQGSEGETIATAKLQPNSLHQQLAHPVRVILPPPKTDSKQQGHHDKNHTDDKSRQQESTPVKSWTVTTV